MHATVGDVNSDKKKVSYILPSYVKNHGVLKGSDLQKLLRETKVSEGKGWNTSDKLISFLRLKMLNEGLISVLSLSTPLKLVPDSPIAPSSVACMST